MDINFRSLPSSIKHALYGADLKNDIRLAWIPKTPYLVI